MSAINNGSTEVLVIDDEHVIVAALRRVLSEEGYPVQIAESAEEGIEHMNAGRFAVAVVDIRLPGMSGVDFLEIAHKRDPETVLILMTGYTSNDQVTEAFERGAFTFLPKPFTFDEASNAVARALCFRALNDAQRQPTGLLATDIRLGMQGWGRHLAGGTSEVGLTDVFLRTMPAPVGIQLPTLDYPLAAGDILARVSGEDGQTYIAWAALGGQVLEVNDGLLDAIDMLRDDPHGEGWIARLR